ncbi:autoinducer binding domain-containing protein [Pseudorhodoferax sp.]|uniref:autoinducer binding domain-containing protein n=1 Tax=Pseudorhodoferax sp. TaxID=1993553 RepID=UPI002DD6959C|nr:autoinducer binding domain-containing protein [Pseudorhodoferax sp.]
MTDWQVDLLDGMSPAPTPEACFERIAAEAAGIGFEFCTHGMRLPVPITRPRTIMHSNYPQAWVKRYHEQCYMDIDPTIAHGMRSSAPVVWNDGFFANARQLWDEAQSHGLRHGWAQSHRDPEGTYSLLVMARSEGPLVQDELQRLAPRMQWLVHAGHEAMKACGQDPAREQPPAGLSDREIDVLRWTAEGKTSAEVADILNISERTVNFHINSVVAKLGACNKTSAAVRAAMLGLLW